MPPPQPPAAADRPLLGIAYMALGVLCLAVMDGLAKYAMAEAPVAQVIFVRSLFVLVFMAPMLKGRGLPALRTTRPIEHTVRVVLAVGAILCFFEALKRLPLATVIAIAFGAPLFMTALSVPLLKERVGIHRWSAVALGFVGVMVIVEPGGEAVSAIAALAVLSSLLFAANMVVLRRLTRTETDAALMFYLNAGVLLAMSAIAPFVWTPLAWREIAAIAAMALALMGGQTFMIRAFRHAPVGAVAPFQYTELLWAALIGYVFWSELPPDNVWYGAVIVIAAGLYVIWRERVRAAAAPP